MRKSDQRSSGFGCRLDVTATKDVDSNLPLWCFLEMLCDVWDAEEQTVESTVNDVFW